MKKLLFITSNRLGDAVLSTGLLHAALQRFTPDEVTIACGPIPAPLFKAVPNLKSIIMLDKKSQGRHWFDLWQKTVLTKWDVVIDLRNSIVSYLIPAKKIFRFTGTRADCPKPQQLAAVLGLGDVPDNKIWLSKTVEEMAEKYIPLGTPVLALCPTANWLPKQWPAENFIAASTQILKGHAKLKNGRIAVFGAVNEIEQSRPIIEALQQDFDVIDLVGQTDPLQAAACLARATLTIANDSGLMHIAAAMNVPTIGLFGPSSDVEYGPHGRNAVAVRGAAFLGLKHTPDPHALMRAIAVDAVVKAAHKLL